MGGGERQFDESIVKLKCQPGLSIRRKTFHPEKPNVDEAARQLMVRGIMEECDVDQDGKISFDEFLPWYRRECVCACDYVFVREGGVVCKRVRE